MRLIKYTFKGFSLFKDHALSLDLYASSRVVDEVSHATRRMTGIGSAVCSQTVVAIAGLNATGKTTVLRATALAGDIIRGNDIVLNSPLYMPLIPLVDDSGLDFQAIFEDQGEWWLLESHLGSASRQE